MHVCLATGAHARQEGEDDDSNDNDTPIAAAQGSTRAHDAGSG